MTKEVNSPVLLPMEMSRYLGIIAPAQEGTDITHIQTCDAAKEVHHRNQTIATQEAQVSCTGQPQQIILSEFLMETQFVN